ELPAVPDTAPARLWCDGRYVLQVNGTEAGRGPVRADPRAAHYDCLDLANLLRPGTNVLAVTARHFGLPTSWWTPAPATFSLGGGSFLFEALIGDDWVASDDRWQTRAGAAWEPLPMPGHVASLPLESFDARRHPWGWEAGADGGDWEQAVEITPVHVGADGGRRAPSEPFGVLRPPVRTRFPDGQRHVARRTTTVRSAGGAHQSDPVLQVVADERVPGGTGPADDTVVRCAYDIGHIAAGTVELVVRGAASGTQLDVAGGEHVDRDGALVLLGQHSGFRYVCAGHDEERFESFDVVGARRLHVSVRDFGDRAPDIEIAVRDRLRPRPAGPTFSCSDPLLERIYEIGVRTVDCCALDAYVDCPTREQRAWTGDSVVHQMVDLVANPDWSMARWHPQLAAQPRGDGMLPMAPASDFAVDDRTVIPDWALHWVRSVHNLYRYCGDRALVAELLPVAERVLRWFEAYLGDDGLLSDVTGWVLIDWASYYSAGTSSALNALWARALEDVAEMARWLGNPAIAEWAWARREAVRAAFDAFWDDGRGVYVDHVVDGRAMPEAAQHGGAAALAAGLVPPERADRVVDRLLDRERLVRRSWVMDTDTVVGAEDGFVHLINGYPEPDWDTAEQMVEAEPFFRYVLHDGMARAGHADRIAELCRDWRVFVDAGETTWPECWVGGTRCHGWSSTPTRDLVVHTLGISPAEPGFGSVRVAPALGGLEWARATVPSPAGP
ncbi:MAG TPA: alpha-L-rhamnosidase C-terminal domain-containing protein, partial [Acidimicrobiales bacterium]|nr:alpha-L-rhamnosidase C-terminal domain-containing protein [Acidimicrobiales bacterium]